MKLSYTRIPSVVFLRYWVTRSYDKIRVIQLYITFNDQSTCSFWNQKLANIIVSNSFSFSFCINSFLLLLLLFQYDGVCHNCRWWQTWFSINTCWMLHFMGHEKKQKVFKYNISTNLRDSPPCTSGQTSIGFQRWILLHQIQKTLQRMHTGTLLIRKYIYI